MESHFKYCKNYQESGETFANLTFFCNILLYCMFIFRRVIRNFLPSSNVALVQMLAIAFCNIYFKSINLVY